MSKHKECLAESISPGTVSKIFTRCLKFCFTGYQGCAKKQQLRSKCVIQDNKAGNQKGGGKSKSSSS